MKSTLRITRGLYVCLLLLCIVVYSFGQENPIQNATLEGIQLSSKETGKEDEIKVTCYFIFKDKPSSYFYDLKWQTKQLVFEFNDTETGASPISSKSEPPVNGFTVKQKRIDVNKDIQGLKPEWHDVVTVTFDMDHIPQLDVKEEYNVVSFSYKWTNDPEKVDQYVLQKKKNRVIPITLGVVGAAALGGGGYALYLSQQPTPENQDDKPLTTSDLPVHKRR